MRPGTWQGSLHNSVFALSFYCLLSPLCWKVFSASRFRMTVKRQRWNTLKQETCSVTHVLPSLPLKFVMLNEAVQVFQRNGKAGGNDDKRQGKNALMRSKWQYTEKAESLQPCTLTTFGWSADIFNNNRFERLTNPNHRQSRWLAWKISRAIPFSLFMSCWTKWSISCRLPGILHDCFHPAGALESLQRFALQAFQRSGESSKKTKRKRFKTWRFIIVRNYQSLYKVKQIFHNRGYIIELWILVSCGLIGCW